jgi:AbrB family looped-hinge helix DNA binding protein
MKSKLLYIGKPHLTLGDKMKFAIAKVSSKGQIVIPSRLRKDIHAGDEFLIVKEKGRIILKKMNDLAKEFIDDFKFAKEVEIAWKEYENGKFKTKSKDDFLKELKAC